MLLTFSDYSLFLIIILSLLFGFHMTKVSCSPRHGDYCELTKWPWDFLI